MKAYEAIVKSENIAEPSIPESFKVLLKEIQSLGLDVNLVADEGTVEMGEEDDELLRAAEELGIDLSGVRAPTATAPPTSRRSRSSRRAKAGRTAPGPQSPRKPQSRTDQEDED